MKVLNTELTTRFFIVFLVLLIGTCITVVSGYGIAGTDDDMEAWNILISGGCGTLILSYPVSCLIQSLYSLLPSIQWYSLLLFSAISLNNLVVAFYLIKTPRLASCIALTLLTLLFQLYIITHFTITIITVFSIACALLIAKRNIYLSLLLMVMATFLRTNIAIPILPFYFTGLLLQREYFHINKTFAIALATSIAVITLNLYSHHINDEYSQWIRFHDAEAAYKDYKGPINAHVFTEPERIIVRSWWMQDESIIPYDKYLAGAPGLATTFRHKLETFSFGEIYKHRYRLLLIVLLLASIVSAIKRKSILDGLLFIAFISGFTLLLITRDADRVTLPLLFLWIAVLVNRYNDSRLFLISVLVLQGWYFYPALSEMADKEKVNHSLSLKEEAIKLISENSLKVEGSLDFPTGWRAARAMYGHYQLFREDTWINYSTPLNGGGFLPFGWSSRHPYFYKMHGISTQKEARQFDSYYDFLLDPNTGFIGGKVMTNNNLSRSILEQYDQVHLTPRQQNMGCLHQAVIIDKSSRLALSQVQLICPDT